MELTKMELTKSYIWACRSEAVWNTGFSARTALHVMVTSFSMPHSTPKFSHSSSTNREGVDALWIIFTFRPISTAVVATPFEYRKCFFWGDTQLLWPIQIGYEKFVLPLTGERWRAKFKTTEKHAYTFGQGYMNSCWPRAEIFRPSIWRLVKPCAYWIHKKYGFR